MCVLLQVGIERILTEEAPFTPDTGETLVAMSYGAFVCAHCRWSSVRDDLHWLPVLQRIVYKLCVIIYRWLHASHCSEIPPSPRAEGVRASHNHCQSPIHHLLWAAVGDLQVLATRTVTFGHHSLAASRAGWFSSKQIQFDSAEFWFNSIRFTIVVSLGLRPVMNCDLYCQMYSQNY